MCANSQTWFNSLNVEEKEKRLLDMCANSQTWFNSLNVEEKQKLKDSKKQMYHSKKDKHELDYFIAIFHRKIREGPYYICTICNRLLYRKTVILSVESKYSMHHLFTRKKSFDSKHYVCKTCHCKLMKKQVPCQAVYNNMQVDDIPPELSVLKKLEQILIARRIVFQKIPRKGN